MINKEFDYCKVCGRKLKNPKYRVQGFGPVCEKRLNNKRRRLFYENAQSTNKAKTVQESAKQE